MKRQKNKKVVVDATIVWKALKPQQYNGFMCGYGYHGKRNMIEMQKNVNR